MTQSLQTGRSCIPVHLWRPMIKCIQIRSKVQLHRLIETEYTGFTLNPNFSILLQDAEAHLGLITKLEGKNNLENDNQTLLADELGISYSRE